MRAVNLFTPTSTPAGRRNQSTGLLWLAAALLLALTLVLPSSAQAQGNYVYVNNQTASNSVNAYSVSATGALTPVPSSPFSTGGTGANVVCYGLNRTTVSGANNLLFVANTGDLTISVFQINPATGALTLAPGSPFASGITLDSCQGMSLAVTPDGNFLMAASNGSIRTFSVAASGALALLSTTPNCCTPIASMIISPDGRFLAASNESSVSMFTITGGVLAPVTGSPFPKTGTGTLSGLDFSCSGNLLYGGEATGSPTITDAWTVSPAGVLTPTPGSPFHTAGNDSNIVLLSPDNSLLFESNQFTNSVNSFSLQANGDLTNLGKFGGSTAVHLPVGMATDSSGTFLYVADDNFGVAVFRINAGGILSSVSDTAINVPGEIQDVAAYPPRSCTSADLSLLMSATPNPVVAGGPIVYTLTITNSGPSPASAVISDTLPASTGPGGTIPIVTGNGVQRVNTVPGASVVTVNTSVPHQLFVGEQISIAGVPNPLSTVPSLNATGFLPDPSFVTASTTVATVPSPTSFTYTQTLATSQFPTPVFSIVASTGAKRAGGAVTITTTRQYAFVPGTTVTIAGVADPSFNGSFTVASAPTSNTFTFAQAGPDISSGGGTATFPIVVAATDTSGGGTANSPSCTVTGSAANFCGSLRAPTIPLVTVPGASRLGNVVTITTLIAHQLKVGNKVTIAGVADASFNGTPTIASVPTATSFTFSQAGANATSGGGTVTFSGAQKTIAAASPGITRIGNVVSAVSTVPHQLQVGDMVNITGVLNTSFNGLFTVASTPSTTTFTFAQTGTNAVSGGGSIATRQTQIITFPLLASGEQETATLIATTSSATANGTVISNTATISNKSVVDPNPSDNSATATVTVSLQAATTLTVPNATGPYGGFAVLSATLTNSATGAPVAGKTITFTLIPTNTVYTGTTNASGVATVSAALGTFSVGTHPSAFTASFGGDPSFGASSSVGTLIVTKAQLTVTADNQSRLYGDPNPPLTYTITGFVNGDTIAVVSGSGSCSTTAIATSPVGPYPITCTQGTLAATNYVFVFAPGTLTVNPAPLTVTVADASRAYGAANPAFTGTITGLKNADVITATYSTTATPASPVGTYPITATLVDPGNVLGNYVVTNIPGTLTVTPAALTVIPNNAARLYGDPNPAFTGVIVGIQNGDNITATYATTATLTSPVGNYPIVATLVDPTNKLGNYVVTLSTGTLVVSPAPLTVNVANATRPIGSPNPVFTGTIVGIKNGDNITATYSTTATPTSPVGTYPITATLVDPTGKLPNYAVTINPGTLTVTTAQLTVTVANATRVYGDPNPAFTVSFSGFINGDTAAVVTGTPSCTSADPTSAVGTYPIVCTQGTLAATNYVFVFVNGTLTVTPAPLTVTAANATRLYGDANPVFTGTITGIKNSDNITATYNTPATVTSLIGTYPIVPSLVDPTLKLGNYTVTSNNATLTITQAPLVVTAANLSRAYAAANPPLTGTITGVRNGDPITVTFATTAIATSPAGIYPITPALNDPAGKLGNYIVTINNGTLTVTAVPLVVTVANATRAYSAPDPAFTGAITGLLNGDNITAVYSTTATVTSPAGTYPITATLVDPGNRLGSYVVTINPGTLTITSSVLTVTAGNASRFYGDPNPVLTGAIVGIANGDNITATYASPATPASLVGAYPIVPTVTDNGTGALANYTVVINNGILTVNPAPLSVTAANATSIYGDPIPVLTGAIVGIKNGDNITAAFATTATPASPAGTYPIVPTLIDPALKLANYTVTSINGTLTVTAAPLTVTANNASRLFGTPNPPLNGIITGIKNGDNITATYATTAVATSPVGTYPITPTLIDPAGKLGNYAVTSNNGTLTVNAAPTGNFVFVNNQAVAGNSISGYSVAADGTLTALAGSPVATGGLGGSAACSSVDRIALSAGNNLLFVSNSGDQSISAFSINPASGDLTAVAGSPFASGLTLDACGGISLAASPDGRFLMASSNGQIKTFSIGTGGALGAASTAANPVVPNASMKISANGQFLAASNGTSVSLYTINGDGSLTAVAGSPFAQAGTGTLAGLDFSSTSGLLFGAEASATTQLADAWTVGTDGVLSAVAGSPFSSTGVNSNAVLLSPDNSLLFASNQGSSNINSFSVSAGGSPASIGSFGSLHAPVGMATDRSGSLLYVADDTFGVAVFSISGAGSLSQLSDTAIAGAGQVQSLVAYPPRMTSTADVSITAAAGSPNVVAGQNVTYTLTVTNNGPDPASATVTDTLPAGFTLVSCAATGNGACAGTSSAANFYLLQSGETQTVTLVATASLSIPDGTVTTNTAAISNSSAVDPNAANNSATVTVTVAQPTTSALTVAPASGTYAGSTTLSATLQDSLGAAIPGKTISFTFNAAPAGSAVTDATGTASIPASLAGINAGTYAGAVSASFAGDANTKAASGSANLVVNPAVLTITAGNASRVYGDPNPTFTFTFSGFVNGETAAVLTGSPSCTTVADPTSAVGTYSITCSAGTLSAANYTFTFVSGTLTITPAPLTVTAADATRVYGDPNPAFTGTLTGIKNGDNITATYSTTATAASAVGTYPITPALADPTSKLGNYTVTSTNGTLTVTPAPLSVTAANATRAFGDPNPVFTGTITGIKNADNITATYSTTATATSPVGAYAIVPALVDPTGKLSNYTVTSANGTLTVSPAPLTVTAANASRFYGDANPVFTGTITGVKNADNITATYASVATATSAPGAYAIVPTLVDPAGALVNYTVVSNSGVLTVNAAPLTVVADSATRAYGTANPVFTGTITGLKNSDAVTATYTSATDATSNAGTYPITPVLSDPTNKLSNYAVTLTNGTLTITPVPLTITAANASRVYGDPNPAFTGTITGLVNGDNITATYSSADPTAAVGTYPIVPAAVDPTGKLGNYTVTLNNGTLTVTPAPLSVTAANASRAYGDPNVLSGTITGIKNGDNITATYSTTATATSVPGTYPIVPALVDPAGKLSNYTVTSTNGTLTITPAVLTVTAANASMIYGDPVPALTGTITGIRNGENITATYSTTATSASLVGTYPIVPAVSDNATGALANYTVVINNGTLTVTPAPLTVTADSFVRLYGDPNPTFTGGIAGVKNGDNITATFGTVADPTSPVGTYPIVPVLIDPTGKLGNYTVTINNGALLINPAPLTVQAADATRAVGQPDPVFSGTITGIKNLDDITATYSTTALATDPAGTYPIIPALVDPTLKLGNYVVTSINGTLTITP